MGKVMGSNRFVQWRDISEAPLNTSLWLYSVDLIDPDYNPTGVAEGYHSVGVGWQVCVWNEATERYETSAMITPTHFALKQPPAIN